MGDECPHRGKWFGRGCLFTPRHASDCKLPPQKSLSPEQIAAVGALHHVYASDITDNLNAAHGHEGSGRSQVYIGDICIRCGKWAKPPNSSAPPA